jgi:hypothetical protein
MDIRGSIDARRDDGKTYDGIKEFIVIPKRIPPPTSSVLNTHIYNTMMP